MTYYRVVWLWRFFSSNVCLPNIHTIMDKHVYYLWNPSIFSFVDLGREHYLYQTRKYVHAFWQCEEENSVNEKPELTRYRVFTSFLRSLVIIHYPLYTVKIKFNFPFIFNFFLSISNYLPPMRLTTANLL